jgi:hypothetical protein
MPSGGATLAVTGDGTSPAQGPAVSRLRSLPAAVALLTTASLWGCVTARGRADQSFERADYVAAAEQYDRLLAKDPTDAGLRARRDEARAAGLAALAARARDERIAGGAPSLAAVGALITRRNQWPEHAGSWTATTIAEETAAAGVAVAAEIRGRLAAEPLGAEADLAARGAQIPAAELAPLYADLGREVRAAGQARCKVTAPVDAAAEPYLARLTAAYCAHFGATAAAPPRLPHAVGAVALTGDIRGMTAAQRARLDAALDGWLRASPWYEPGATAAAATVTGAQAASFAARPVTLDAPWTEYISYQVQEPYQESYQESYRESYQEPYQESYRESYTERVAHTSYRSESYSCGYGTSQRTCTRSVPHTDYRSETRYRTAYRTKYRTAYRTAYRTKYRTAYRTVTRTRSEPRTHHYLATARSGLYTGTWSLALDLGAAPLELRIDAADQRMGYDHDEYFPAAGVEPSRANLDSFDVWSERLLLRLGTELPSRLVAQWGASFCREATYTAETAARCGYAAVLPAPARGELSRLFGGDVDRVVAAFAPRR